MPAHTLAGARDYAPHAKPPRLGSAIAGTTLYELLAISARLPPHHFVRLGAELHDGLRLNA